MESRTSGSSSITSTWAVTSGQARTVSLTSNVRRAARSTTGPKRRWRDFVRWAHTCSPRARQACSTRLQPL
jgi:hypothetical protein